MSHRNWYRLNSNISYLLFVAALRSKDDSLQKYEEISLLFFINMINKMKEIIQDVNLSEEYHKLPIKQISSFENFCQQLALLLSTYFQHNLDLIEQVASNPGTKIEMQGMIFNCTKIGLELLLQLSLIPNEEVFKICTEFWYFFSYTLYTKFAQYSHQKIGMVSS
jgi:hypothetical protein